MNTVKILIAILFSAALAGAQEIPAGTALPVQLTSTLDARKIQPGQPISAVIQQDVPLPGGAKIPAGARVNGQVLQGGVNPDGSSYLHLRFDQVRAKKREIPVSTSVRAVASWWEVQNAQLPSRTPTRGESATNWTTTQIGGDVVYRGGGHVMHDDAVVGEPVYRGVLAQLYAVPDAGCETDSNDRPMALWVFSSYACGAYGFEDLRIAQAGRSHPVGEIVLVSKSLIKLHSGSGWLLITQAPPQP